MITVFLVIILSKCCFAKKFQLMTKIVTFIFLFIDWFIEISDSFFPQIYAHTKILSHHNDFCVSKVESYRIFGFSLLPLRSSDPRDNFYFELSITFIHSLPYTLPKVNPGTHSNTPQCGIDTLIFHHLSSRSTFTNVWIFKNRQFTNVFWDPPQHFQTICSNLSL
jgi:hypothetical protein